MFQIQIQIPGLPIFLICRSDAAIAWVISQPIPTLIDMPSDGTKVGAIFTQQGFSIGDDEFDYQVFYPYKEIPSMLQWLVQQEMPNPFPKEIE